MVFFRAPEGCVQYYTGWNGNLRSFNRADAVPIQSLTTSYCIRREKGIS